MAQIINNISTPNDGLGDSLRKAFDQQNQMNTELYARNGSNILATNPSTLAQDPIDDILEALGGNVIVEADITDLDKYTQLEVDVFLADKVDKITGKGLSEENYTSTEKSKLASITEIFTTVLKTAYDSAVTWVTTNGTDVLKHLQNQINPHNVTKSQVGLGNVDNTSDLNKPISTATQNALDLKLDKVTTSGVERAYIINADGSQGTKPTSDLGVVAISNDLALKLDKTLFNYTSMLTPIRGTSGLTIIGYPPASAPSIGNTARNGDGLSKITNMNRLGYVTTAVAGYVASFRQTPDVAHMSYPFEALFSFGKGVSVANQRSGYGFFNNSNTATNVEATTLLNCFGICELSTSNNWHIFHNDNAGLATTIDLGVNFPCKNTNTDIINFYMKNIVGTGIYYEVECNGNISSGTITTDLPTSTSLWYKWWTTNNTTASSCSIEIFKFTLNLNLQ